MANELRKFSEILEYVTFLLEQDAGLSEDEFWPRSMIEAFIVAEHKALIVTINQGHERFFFKVAVANVQADLEFYSLPVDLRKVELIERRVAAGENLWEPILPLTDGLEERKDHHAKDGVTATAVTGGVGIFSNSQDPNIRYAIVGKTLHVVPFFSTSMTDGLRMWFYYSPLGPTGTTPSEDDWVPFGGLLPEHHEILAIGAAIRSKKREEVPDQWSDLWRRLHNNLVHDVEKRQTQRRSVGPEHEGYY